MVKKIGVNLDSPSVKGVHHPLLRPVTPKQEDHVALEVKEEMGKSFKLGNFALAEVKYAAGDIKPAVIEGVGSAQKKVEIRVDNIAGVKVPVFKAVDVEIEGADYTGLSKGGQQITKARETFAKAVDVLVQLASLQTSFVILDEAIKVTNRRVNALDSVVIPKITNLSLIHI